MTSAERNKLWRQKNRESYNARQRERYAKNKERMRATHRKCYRKYADKYNAMTVAWQKANPEKVKLYWRRSHEKNRVKRNAASRIYKRKMRFAAMGVTEEDYNRMSFQQKGVCWICGVDPKPHQGSSDAWLAVDHDHLTGLVRGLLCQKCNKGLGLFNDDPSLLVNAVSYLAQTAKEVAA